MTVAYFDTFSGISGDMILGALIDAGVPIDAVRAELGKLKLDGYELRAEKVTRGSLSATKVEVLVGTKHQSFRNLPSIAAIVDNSALPSPVKQISSAIFRRLAEAEAKIHNQPIEHVHFHELGAIDTIIDIVGSVIGLELLEVTQTLSSALNLGSGSVAAVHGTLPVPAPATMELLKGVPIYTSSNNFELTTPTGAAIISTLASSFGPLPNMKIDRVGYGAGSNHVPGQANVLRVMLGSAVSDDKKNRSILIETAIDDMNPQIYAYLIERLLRAGAHDAYLTPILMKKGRPGTMVSVLTDGGKKDAVLDIIFRETSSIGVRIQEVEKRGLSREMKSVDTSYGTVRVKISKQEGAVRTITPEFEDCKRIAEEHQVPLKTVIDEAKNSLVNRG